MAVTLASQGTCTKRSNVNAECASSLTAVYRCHVDAFISRRVQDRLCAAAAACASWSLVRDEAEMQQRLTRHVAMQTFRPGAADEDGDDERNGLVR